MAELTSAQQHLLSAQTIDGGQPRSLFRTPISTWKMFFQHLPVQGLRIASNKREAEDIVHVPGLLTV
ncbi:MAG: hypothetical protein O7G88_12370, partial [bacterium]|nr:hypothetical protein [bacterium]